MDRDGVRQLGHGGQRTSEMVVERENKAPVSDVAPVEAITGNQPALALSGNGRIRAGLYIVRRNKMKD